MTDIDNLPFLPLQFDKRGQTATPGQEEAIGDTVRERGITDLFVVSHGWQNDAGYAMALYEALFRNVAPILRSRSTAGRQAAIVGVFWPSKPRYKDYGNLTKATAAAAGGAASAVAGAGADAAQEIRDRLEDFKSFFADDPEGQAALDRIEEAQRLAPSLNGSEQAMDKFVRLLRETVTDEPTATDEDRSDRLVDQETPGHVIMRELEQTTLQAPRLEFGSGGATSIGDIGPPPTFGTGQAAGLFDSIGSAALKLVDQLSYYEMKERAGEVGLGLQAVLERLYSSSPNLRVHLVGHSFGGRVVTSAASGRPRYRPASMTLLQAAFSHNAFSANYNGRGGVGFFRSVVTNGVMAGPIVITHTANDDAVGVAYPIASKLAGQQANSIGGPDDIYGAIGRNGAVRTDEAVQQRMLGPDGRYTFDLASGRIFNLLADNHIQDRDGRDAHGDVTNPAVANVVASAAGY